MFHPRKRILFRIATNQCMHEPLSNTIQHQQPRHYHNHIQERRGPHPHTVFFNPARLFRLLALTVMSLDSFSEIFHALFNRGGGRRPQLPNQQALDADEDTWLHPAAEHEARLTIVQITDVYTLDNFASLKTMLETIRTSQQPAGKASNKNNKVVSMLTGDFLAPYLLSSIDHGKGMMMAIDHTPIDYLTWGNHGMCIMCSTPE